MNRVRSTRLSPAGIGLAGAVALIIAAMVVPKVAGWDVHIGFPPVYAHWMPRIAPSSIIAVGLGLLGIAFGGHASRRLTWPVLLVVSWLASLVWLASLALVDGKQGLSARLDTNDYLRVARHTTNISHLLHEYVDRIPLGPHGWHAHVAGHPPGALLFFVLLVRLGLGGNLVVGIVVTLVASTIAVAVLCTLRALAEEHTARLVAPFLVLGPAAVWEAVSGDAVFAAFAAWGLAALAMATRSRMLAWSVVAGLLLGSCVMMSYGLPLLGFLALSILIAARTFRPLVPTLITAVLVVAGFWLAGFSLWDAYAAIHQRYWAGVASQRSAGYWLWGDLAALCFSAGPVVGSAFGCWLARTRHALPGRHGYDRSERVVCLVGGAAVASVLAADASLMSKAEVERIWLPFVPWLLVMCALLPPPWRRPALAVQVVAALVLQHLFLTGW